jgi:hypothetical protein
MMTILIGFGVFCLISVLAGIAIAHAEMQGLDQNEENP